MAKESKKQNTKLQKDFRYRYILAGILVLTWIAYLPSLNNSFVNWDDPKYLLENHLVWDLTPANVKELFFGTELNGRSYVPLSQLSFAIENSFIKPDYTDLARFYEYARPLHYTNLLLHLLNTALVFFLVRMLTANRWLPAAVTALFFGVHPMHVESVAWITERKDVLFTSFFLWSAMMWIRFLDSPHKKKLYIYSLGIFVLALLAKSAAVTLPAVLGLIIYWRNGRFVRKDVMLLAPYLVLGFLHGMITVIAAKSVNTIASTEAFSLIERIMFASYGTIMYLVKLFVPYGLTNYYPYPSLIDGHLPLIFYLAPFLVIVLFFLIYLSYRYTRLFVFGFLFFMATVALTLQLIPVGPNIMCERYTYVPYIGLFFIAGQGVAMMGETGKQGLNLQKMLLFIMGGAALWFAWLTYERCKVWENSEVLWTDVIGKYRYEVPVAYKNRGNYYGKRQVFDKALADYNIFLQLKQDDAGIFVNRGNIFGLQGDHQRAMQDFSRAIAIDPDNADALINRAITYSMTQQYDKAIEDYNKALAAEPGKWLDIYQNRGFTYIQTGRFDEGIKDFNAVLQAIPQNYKAWFYRGVALFNKGEFQQALNDFNQSLNLNPNHAAAYYNRSLTYNRLGRKEPALQDALRAKQMGYAVGDQYLQQLR